MLGLSDAGLRRLAPIYERVHGPMARDQRRGRVWTAEAVDQLRRARTAVRAGRAASVQAALVAERTGDLPGSGEGEAPPPNTLAELVAEIRGLRMAVESQNRMLEEQAERLRAIEAAESEPRGSLTSPEENIEGHRAGEAPAEPETGVERQERRPWWRRWFGG
jgi:hypothetical protein